MLYVIIACVIFALMAISKIIVDKSRRNIEAPLYFPQRGTEFKAEERKKFKC